MKRKFLIGLLLCLCTLFCAIGVVACSNDNNGNVDGKNKQIVSIYNTYVAYAEENGTMPLSYEEWLNSIKGKDGVNGLNGKDGADGKDGENGNDGVGIADMKIEDGKLYVKYTNGKDFVELGQVLGADGKDGLNGKDGADGKDGIDGKDGADGKDGENGNDGVGIADMKIEDGKLFVKYTNGKDFVELGQVLGADGKDGIDGADGKDGIDGKDGADGKDGLNGKDGADGKDGLNGKDGADGKDGIDGKDGVDGKDGKDGKDGREIKSAEIDAQGNLIITYKDDTTENLGKIKDNSKCEHEYSDYIITEIGDIGYRKEYYCKRCHEEKSELYIYTDGIEYALSEDGESAYVKSIGTATDKEIILRNTYQGKPVTNIEYKAFLGCENITKITIWDSITKIKHDAFYGCDNLVDVNYLGTIDSWCEIVGLLGLMNYGTNYVIDGAQTYGMERNLYINGELISDIEITTAKKIEYCAFNGCKNLKSVIIGDSVTEIGSQAFKYCCSLTEVVMGSNITNIGQEAFRDCDSLKSIEIPNGLTVIEDSTFNSCNSLTDISMGENITYIGNFAFDGCYSLKSIEIPNSVTDIRSHAFAYCSNLKSVEIPNSVTYIGSHVFYCCASLTNIVIPNSITSIESYEFSFCSSLKNIEIPNSITSIGNSAFHQCRSLEKVNYLGNIDEWVKIDFGGFNANPLMDSSAKLYINNEPVTKVDLTIATTIKAYAFYKCDSITSITIGKQVESISAHITSLEEINYNGTILEWGLIEKDENWWWNDKGSITIHCTDGDITLKK